MERDAAPAAAASSAAAPGGEGSPSGLHYEGSAFNGWTGARRAGRKPRARGWETALPCRRKRGPDSQKSPRWSAERRGILRQDAAASCKGAEVRCACRRSAPLTLFGEGLEEEGAPGASNN